MSVQENKEFIRAYLAAISGTSKTADLIDKYVEEQSLKDHAAFFEAAFPLYQVIPLDMIAEGDQVAVKARFIGTHQGELNGIPATRRTVDMPFHITYRVQNGKIVEHWMVTDTMELLRQIGVVPEPGAAD